jgi:hypothetical protein
MSAAMAPVDQILAFIEAHSADDIAELPRDIWIMLLSSIPDAQDRQRVIFAKNIKLFGGINEYIESFLPSVQTMINMPAGPGRISAIDGAKYFLQRMADHESTTAANKALVLAAKARLENTSGGGHRRRRTHRKKRSTRK